MIRQALDWIVALAVLILLAPFLVALMIAIRLDSPGPAIFRQTRIGYRGRPFTMYKLRTMKVAEPKAQEEREHAMTKRGDDRITRVGHFLRVTRLDELPQLINILKGEMGWIGPRPEAAPLSAWYEAEIPFYSYRHIVRPGITGWAQVNQGHVAAVEDVSHKLHYDFYYIKNFSPWLDIVIALKTLKTIKTGFGAC
jgi:lipopolysaccharide/colanic/teichoic acid biosynthesis glycosyltransferase